MKFIHFSASCRLMQSVNILCHNSLQFSGLLQFCQFQMGSIWLRIQNHHLLFIKLIECFRIFHKKAMTDHLLHFENPEYYFLLIHRLLRKTRSGYSHQSFPAAAQSLSRTSCILLSQTALARFLSP